MVLLDVTPSPIGEPLAEPPSLPTNLDSDEPPLETDWHRNQIDLLIRLLKYWWRDRDNFYISGNLTVYYNQQQLKQRDFRGPDLFVVLGVDNRDRRSWTIWEEGGKYPNLVIELLSNSTASVDRSTKKDLYQDIWRVPEYFWFHPETLEFAGFHLINGHYQPIPTTEAGWLWSEQLQLYLGIHGQQLRWFTPAGQLIPLPEEAERQAREQAQQAEALERQAKEQAQQAEALERRAKEQAQQAEALERQAKEQAQQAEVLERQAKEQAQQAEALERQAKEQAQRRAEQLEALLRAQGIDPDQQLEL